MNDLIERILAKTDLSEEDAKEVYLILMEYLKEELPESISDRLEDLLER